MLIPATMARPALSGRAIALRVLTLLALVLSVAACRADTDPPTATRIMFVGDSITQGKPGDWTWRYRLAKDLDQRRVAYDFVGPNTGLYDASTGQFDASGYRDPGFDQDHAARWGATYEDLGATIGTLVKTYRPDVVVDLLGTNDLGLRARSGPVVAQLAEKFVADARASDPEVDIVLFHVVDRVGESDWLNVRLDVLADQLDSTSSRVIIGDAGGYLEPSDLYDGVHPNEAGERKIAQGVAAALASLGIDGE